MSIREQKVFLCVCEHSLGFTIIGTTLILSTGLILRAIEPGANFFSKVAPGSQVF